jgi:hypothetical protein
VLTITFINSTETIAEESGQNDAIRLPPITPQHRQAHLAALPASTCVPRTL